MRRLFFFFLGASLVQSGDSISVCCHKMAGQPLCESGHDQMDMFHPPKSQ